MRALARCPSATRARGGPSASSDRDERVAVRTQRARRGDHLVVRRLRAGWYSFEQTPRRRRPCGSVRDQLIAIRARVRSRRPASSRSGAGRASTGSPGCAPSGGTLDRAGRVADGEEAREPPALRFVGVDRERLEAAAAGMRDVVGAAAERAPVPGVDEIEHQRRVNGDRRVQAARRLPRAIAHAGDELAVRARSDAAARAGRCRRRRAARRSCRVTLTCSRSTDEST